MPEPFPETPGRALSRVSSGDAPRGLVLMLHGGTQHSQEPVTSGSASLRRVEIMRNALAPAFASAGAAVWLLRYSVRGWNAPSGGVDGSPVADARWALDQVRAAYGDVPVVLLGHSMGARTASRVADDPNVTGMVGLAPWFEPSDPISALAGKDLVAGHGLRDRITSARHTRQYVERARRVTASAEFVPLGLAGHYMIYRPFRWNRFARERTLAVLEHGVRRHSGSPRPR